MITYKSDVSTEICESGKSEVEIIFICPNHRIRNRFDFFLLSDIKKNQFEHNLIDFISGINFAKKYKISRVKVNNNSSIFYLVRLEAV